MQTRPGYGWLALFTVVYWSCTWALSRAKPLWFDELFTYYMARLAISDQISALRSGIETNPPGFPWLVGVSQALLGVSELTTRLPAMPNKLAPASTTSVL